MIAQARKEANEAKQLAEKHRQEAETERKRLAQTEERQALQSALNGKVKPALLDMVVHQLHQTRIQRDPESGAILWKDDDGDFVPYKDGIEAWSKSDAGKEVAPPIPAGGSGGRGPDGALRGSGPMTLDVLGSIVGGGGR